MIRVVGVKGKTGRIPYCCSCYSKKVFGLYPSRVPQVRPRESRCRVQKRRGFASRPKPEREIGGT